MNLRRGKKRWSVGGREDQLARDENRNVNFPRKDEGASKCLSKSENGGGELHLFGGWIIQRQTQEQNRTAAELGMAFS